MDLNNIEINSMGWSKRNEDQIDVSEMSIQAIMEIRGKRYRVVGCFRNGLLDIVGEAPDTQPTSETTDDKGTKHP